MTEMPLKCHGEKNKNFGAFAAGSFAEINR